MGSTFHPQRQLQDHRRLARYTRAWTALSAANKCLPTMLGEIRLEIKQTPGMVEYTDRKNLDP